MDDPPNLHVGMSSPAVDIDDRAKTFIFFHRRGFFMRSGGGHLLDEFPHPEK
jgi:hypothetical protein